MWPINSFVNLSVLSIVLYYEQAGHTSKPFSQSNKQKRIIVSLKVCHTCILFFFQCRLIFWTFFPGFKF